jgi:tRNA (guanine-N7-)-methyltransferase
MTTEENQAEEPIRRSRATEAFYGRRHGRPVRTQAAEAVASLLPRLKLDLTQPAPDDLKTLFPVPVERVRLEIGFGGGEHVISEAGREPQSGFIGVEPFVNGMSRCMQTLETEPRQNLRVYDDDATRLLDWLPANSIAEIDLLYPDPWPKKKHWKRRFVSPVNLDRFARVLQPGGVFRFASDIEHYVNWTLLHIRAHPQFEWVAKRANDWRQPYPGWQSTRYEAKALREGRTPAYLTFRRL